MQKDMHFFGVYALARCAGILPGSAYKIAYASQFVDDAIDDEAIVIDGDKAVLPTMTSHRPIDYQNTIPGDQWKVWVPFHFLPGNQPGAQSFVEKMVCRKDSAPAQDMLAHAIKHRNEPFGLHLVGITAHVYADTFAHYGFVGLSRPRNRVDNDSVDIKVAKKSIKGYLSSKYETFKTRAAGMLAESVPVGHGAVGTFPDRPFLNWEYESESGQKVERNNFNDFCEACQKLHAFFTDFAQGNQAHANPDAAVSWDGIEAAIQSILKEESSKDDRIARWSRAITSGDLFASQPEDHSVQYSEKSWRAENVVYHFADGGNANESDACLFIQAAWKHRNFVLHELLPKNGLLIEQ